MDLDLARDVAPLFGLAERAHQIVERGGGGVGELEPGQKVERLADVAGMVEPPGDGREISPADRHVARAGLEDRAPLVLRELPPGIRLSDRDQHGALAVGPAQPLLHQDEPVLFRALDVPVVAPHSAQDPSRARGLRELAGFDATDGGRRRKGRAAGGGHPLHPPLTGRAPDDADPRHHRRHFQAPGPAHDRRKRSQRALLPSLPRGLELSRRWSGHPQAMRRISFTVVALAILGAISAQNGCANGDTAAGNLTATGGAQGEGKGGSSASGGTGTATGGATGQGGSGAPATGGSAPPTSGTGGTPATGGTTGAGGTPATGGVPGTGGKPATGGTTGAGGTPATGGSPGTGGTPATGGTTGTGGAAATGGSSGFGQPACGNTMAGTAIAKGVMCTAADATAGTATALCYKTC